MAQKLLHPSVDVLQADIPDKEALEMEANLKAYHRWKEECAKKGKTPADMVQFYRSMGQDDYADQVEDIIQRMEELSASLA